MDNNNGEKKRFEGNWKCAKCGKEITSLPFEPKGKSVERLQCIECYRKAKEAEE
jgi:CxxC-x17-CxxC domain-containing protein